LKRIIEVDFNKQSSRSPRFSKYLLGATEMRGHRKIKKQIYRNVKSGTLVKVHHNSPSFGERRPQVFPLIFAFGVTQLMEEVRS
jgi:hypothetical protein